MRNRGNDKVQIDLGPFKSTDIDAVSKWQNTIEDRRLIMGFRFPVSDSTSLDWLEQRINPLPKHPTSIYWAVRTVLEDNLVGYVSIFDIDYVSGTAEIGIYLSDLRGSGVGTDSINRCIERVRKDLNLRKVSARTLSTNLAALKLFKKLGFLHEGTLSSQYWDGERYCDVEILSKFI